MPKKFTPAVWLIIITLTLGIFCGGLGYMVSNVQKKIKAQIAGNQQWLESNLTTVFKTWDPKEFEKIADEAYLTTEGKKGTAETFAMLKTKLGALKSLTVDPDYIQDRAKMAKATSKTGLFMSHTAVGKFENGEAKISLTVRNYQGKRFINVIRVD